MVLILASHAGIELNPQSGFPVIMLGQPKKVAWANALSTLL